MFAGNERVLVPVYDGLDEGTFLRGDANTDDSLSLLDAMSILRYLHSGLELRCLDAADFDDSGRIELTDALALLNIVVLRSSDDANPVEAPYPVAGTDPTFDVLGCAQGSSREQGAGEDAGGERFGLAPGAGAAAAACRDGDGAPDLEFIHSLERVQAVAGQKSLRIPLFLESAAGVAGFTISLYAPPESITIDDISFEGTELDNHTSPGSRWSGVMKDEGLPGYVAASFVVSLYSGETLPTLPGRVIAEMVLSISPDARVGTQVEIEFKDTPSRGALPPIRNELSRDGGGGPYRACGLQLEIVSPADRFIRGDVNRDWRLGIADAAATLRALFGQGVEQDNSFCADAADFDDNGLLQLSDALALLNFLFANGIPPVLPFPNPGLDTPDADALGCGVAR
jgi:hypothetical protein